MRRGSLGVRWVECCKPGCASSCTPEVRKCFQSMQCHRDRMGYAQLQAQGLCTGSGVVEAACKAVAGTRLKRWGMRWSRRGVNAMLALRCSPLHGRIHDFRERPAEHRRAA